MVKKEIHLFCTACSHVHTSRKRFLLKPELPTSHRQEEILKEFKEKKNNNFGFRMYIKMQTSSLANSIFFLFPEKSNLRCQRITEWQECNSRDYSSENKRINDFSRAQWNWIEFIAFNYLSTRPSIQKRQALTP